jgi:hypothetical protein
MALAQSPDAGEATADDTTAGEVALLLAPLVAAATVIERIIEMVFNWYESLILNASDLLGEGKGYLKWAKDQVKNLQNTTNWANLSGGALKDAEDALQDAQGRLEGYLSSPFYTSRKRVLTLLLGLVFGVIIAVTTQLQLLHLIADMFGAGGAIKAVDFLAAAGKWVDIVITGFIIGLGTGPLHALIGLLQNTKNAVDQARALWSGTAYRTAMEAELKKIEELRKAQAASPAAPGTLGKGPGVVPAAAAAPPPTQQIGTAELDRRIKRIVG